MHLKSVFNFVSLSIRFLVIITPALLMIAGLIWVVSWLASWVW